MWRRKKKKVQVQPSEITLASQDGTVWMSFSADVVDSMRRLILHIGRKDDLPESLSMIAALRQEGVTFISRALGTTIAHDLEVTVCIVECNWWWPFTLPGVPTGHGGLAGVLTGDFSLESALIPTSFPNLTILPAGDLPPMERFPYSKGAKLREVIDKLNTRYDHLILDVPAVLSTNEAIPLASLGTAVCMVVHHGATFIEDVRQTLDEIDHLPIVGVVMNQRRLSTPSVVLKIISQF